MATLCLIGNQTDHILRTVKVSRNKTVPYPILEELIVEGRIVFPPIVNLRSLVIWWHKLLSLSSIMTVFLGPTKVSVSTNLHQPWYLPLIAINSCLRQGLKTVDVQVRWTWIRILTATYGMSMGKSVKMPEASQLRCQIPHLWKRAGQWHHFRIVRTVKWDNNAKYLAQWLKQSPLDKLSSPLFSSKMTSGCIKDTP